MRQRSLARSTRRSNGVSGGRVASQYLAGSVSPSGHSISSHSSSRSSVRHSSRWAARTRTRAKREVSAPALPSRQQIVCQPAAGRPGASVLTLTGWCSASRRMSWGGRPRPHHGSGGSGAVPGGHTEVCDGIPGDIGQPQSADRLAQPSIDAIPGVHQHNTARQTGRAGRPDLLQRNLWLGQKPDRLGDAGRGVARGIGTVLEAMMIWQLLQVRHLEDAPFILVGKMYAEFVAWCEDHMLHSELNLANPEDLALPQCVEDGAGVLQIVHEHYSTWAEARKQNG